MRHERWAWAESDKPYREGWVEVFPRVWVDPFHLRRALLRYFRDSAGMLERSIDLSGYEGRR